MPIDDFMFSDYIGIDFALNDADETEAREDSPWYNGDGVEGGAWNVPSSWGTAYLSDVMLAVNDQIETPNAFELAQNYPNPFNPTTTIPFALDTQSDVTLNVYNLIGHKVATLVNERKDAGVYHVSFDASHLPSGIYYYQLQAGTQTETKKMVLMQ